MGCFPSPRELRDYSVKTLHGGRREICKGDYSIGQAWGYVALGHPDYTK